MNGLKLLQVLAEQGKTVLTVKDAEIILRTSPQNASVLLSRLASKGLLFKIRGKKAGAKYVPLGFGASSANPVMQSWYILAREYIIPRPYYLSHYTAMALHNMTSQPINTIFVSSTARPKETKAGSVKLHLVYCNPENMAWGVQYHWITKQEQVVVSDLPRTLLDVLDRPDLAGGIVEIAKGLWLVHNRIDWARLVEYLNKIGKGSVCKRISYLVDTLKIKIPDTLMRQMEKQRSKYQGYVKLEPLGSDEGKHRKEYGLHVNINPQEIIRATHA